MATQKIISLGLGALSLCLVIKHSYDSTPHYGVMAPHYCTYHYSFSPLPKLLSVFFSNMLLFLSVVAVPHPVILSGIPRICDLQLFLVSRASKQFHLECQTLSQDDSSLQNKWISSLVLAHQAKGASVIPNPPLGFRFGETVGFFCSRSYLVCCLYSGCLSVPI